MDDRARLAENRHTWNAVVRDHVGSDFYDVRGFLRGRDPLGPIEDAAVGEVRGRSLLHLMCHFGLDSLGWARRGAVVTGVDFAPDALDVARQLAAREGLDARFVESEVTAVAHALEGATFERVVSTWGVTIWLPDLHAWARAVAACLAPGGSFHLLEVHPLAWVFLDPTAPDEVRTTPQQPYRSEGVTLSEQVGGSYAAPHVARAAGRQHLWHHGLGDVVTALVGAGLLVDRLVERDVVTTPVLPALVQGADGLWRWPGGVPSLPLSYEVRAIRP